MGKIKDSQKSKVYKWEEKHIPITAFGEQLSLKECEDLIRQALTWWLDDNDVWMPIIKDGRGTQTARGGAKRISLPRWARNHGVVLHEIAHCLLFRMGERSDGGHGPYFMRTYIELLGKFYRHVDKSNLLREAKAAKIKVAPTDHLPLPPPENCTTIITPHFSSIRKLMVA